MKDMKFLFETTISKLIENPTIEKTVDANGNKIEIKRILKKLQPIKVAILKPDRRLFKAAEIFYSKTLADYLKAGLLPYSLVSKRYANDGGPLSETEKVRIETLKAQAIKLEQEFFAKTGPDADGNTESKNELLVQINKINSELGQIQSAYSDIFESTAEMKARNDTLEWWSLQLSLIQENSKEYKPLFGEGSYDEKMSKLDEFDEMNDDFYSEVIRRLSFLVSFWFTARNTTISTTDFSNVEKLYLETSNNYNPVEDPDPQPLITETPANVST